MTPTLDDVVAEARRVLAEADQRSVLVRLLGGVAIRLRAGDAVQESLRREYMDIDLVTQKRASESVQRLLVDVGYTPDKQFNTLYGDRRMLFFDLPHDRQLDVFIDTFSMCHTIPLSDRISVEPTTIPLAELLLTKLQVVELNEKDLVDILTLFAHHTVGDEDSATTINARRVAALCASDWGLWRTTKMNIMRVHEAAARYPLSGAERETIELRASNLWARIEAEPKTRRWRMRDRIGDRKRWYEEPEEKG
jgi:hypothetical protein